MYIDMSDDIKSLNKNEAAVNTAIRNVLSAPVGSTPGNPEFGCNLMNYVFEIIDPLTSALIKEEVIYALGRWENRIVVKDVEVTEDFDYNRIFIKIYFTIKSNVRSEDHEYIFSVLK